MKSEKNNLEYLTQFNLESTIKGLKFRLVSLISTYPPLYYSLRKMIGKMDHLCVREDTEIVIEGYPRSANSSTAHGFLSRQPRPVKLAHHKHHAAQLLFAAKHNIPAVLLIRQPEQAVLSHLALGLENQLRNPGGKRGTLKFQDALRGWLIFYSTLENCTDSFVIAPFSEVIQDIEGMIRQVNIKFGTKFSDKVLIREQDKSLGWHATPNDTRNNIKNDLSKKFIQALDNSSQLRIMLDEANALHAKFLSLYEVQNLTINSH